MSNMTLLKKNDRECSLPSNMYPQLGKYVSLHISPGYGLVLHGQPPSPLYVSSDTINILAGCNGMQTVGEIITYYINAEGRGNDIDISEAILTLTDLITKRIVILDENPKKVKVRITGSHKIFYPMSMQVELTTNCNLSCSYCYRNSGAYELGRLKTNKLLKILQVLSDNGLHSVELTGGEPLLHPDFVRILRFCGKQFSIVGLLTNGTLITESLIRELLLFKEKMVISVSLDSHISDVHDKRRGLKGAFEKTLHGICLLAQNGFFTRVSMSVDQDNWKDVELTLLLARQLGASMFTYSPILPFGRAKDKFDLWDQNPEEVLQTEQRLSEKYKGFLHFLPEDKILEINQPGGCGAGHRVYAMAPAGLVRPCVTFDEDQAVFGSLITQSPAEVFGGKLSKAFSMIKPPHMDLCDSCKWTIFCQHCSLRGLMASHWVGEENCRWLNQPNIRQWSKLVRDHALGEVAGHDKKSGSPIKDFVKQKF